MSLASQKFFNAADGCWYEISNSREWHEEDHPRGSDGKFTDGAKGEQGIYRKKDGTGNGFYDVVKADGKYYIQQFVRSASGKRIDVGSQKISETIGEDLEKVEDKNEDFLSKFQKKKWKSGQEYEGATFEYNGAQIDARKDGDWIVGRYYAPEGKKIKGTVDTWSDFEVKEKDFNSYIKNLIKPETFIDK